MGTGLAELFSCASLPAIFAVSRSNAAVRCDLAKGAPRSRCKLFAPSSVSTAARLNRFNSPATAIPPISSPMAAAVHRTRPNGMIHGAFRPSDDACTPALQRPGEPGAGGRALMRWPPLAQAVGAEASSAEARAIAADVRAGVARDGVVDGVWVYEIDGLGSVVRMDDANAPSLLAPALPFAPADPMIPSTSATRSWVLSADNPWRFSGTAATGIGSPHTGPRKNLADRTCDAGSDRIDRLRKAHLRTHARRDPCGDISGPTSPSTPTIRTIFTRSWFAWANSLVGEFLEQAAREGLLA